MTVTREETIERLKQNKAAAEFYASQSRITAEIENALKDSEAFDMAIEALSADAVQIHNDGTLEVTVPNAHKVGRVLVMDVDSHIGGGLFYPDDAEAEQGEWKPFDTTWGRSIYYCSVCEESTYVPTEMGNPIYNYCPLCGSYMRKKGGAE